MRRAAVLVLALALAGCAGAASAPPSATPQPTAPPTTAPTATATPGVTLTPWYPSDFKPWIEDSNLAYRFMDGDEFSCTRSYATGCWGVVVMAERDGCQSVSVLLAVLNTDGSERRTVVGSSDGPAAPFEQVKIVINGVEDDKPKATITQIDCEY